MVEVVHLVVEDDAAELWLVADVRVVWLEEVELEAVTVVDDECAEV